MWSCTAGFVVGNVSRFGALRQPLGERGLASLPSATYLMEMSSLGTIGLVVPDAVTVRTP